MSEAMNYEGIGISIENYVAVVEIQKGPNNFFDTQMIKDLADAFEKMDASNDVRAIVLCSEGKHFCAGNNFGSASRNEERADRKIEDGNPLYAAAVKLFDTKTPVVGAIQGAAVGGGFGLAVMPDFRVVCPEARFTANFVKLGFHPGFGLTHTLPRLIGQQKASMLFLTGRRISGQEAFDMGLAAGIYLSVSTIVKGPCRFLPSVLFGVISVLVLFSISSYLSNCSCVITSKSTHV